MPKVIKNAYVWCEDGTFTKGGEIINYTKFYVNIAGVDINVVPDKGQLRIATQCNKVEYEDLPIEED